MDMQARIIEQLVKVVQKKREDQIKSRLVALRFNVDDPDIFKRCELYLEEGTNKNGCIG